MCVSVCLTCGEEAEQDDQDGHDARLRHHCEAPLVPTENEEKKREERRKEKKGQAAVKEEQSTF